MKIFLVLFLTFYISLGCFAQGDWELEKDKEGVKVFVRHMEGNSFLNFKVQTSIRCSLDKLKTFLIDYDNYVNWVYICQESYKVEARGDTIIYYNSFDSPWPVSDRDVYLSFFDKGEVNGRHVFEIRSAAGFEIDEDQVRIPVFDIDWVIEDQDSVLIVEQVGFTDPGGSVPTWLVNSTVVNGPFDSFVDLKKVLDE